MADVALLAEGVDRNTDIMNAMEAGDVALLAEGVDRNLALADFAPKRICRPPRGGRG